LGAKNTDKGTPTTSYDDCRKLKQHGGLDGKRLYTVDGTHQICEICGATDVEGADKIA
jgi:hypothetical protein